MDGVGYRDSGVDIDAGNEAVRRIKALARSTYTPSVLSGVGSFGGLFALGTGHDAPVLVASADGVGTKLRVAFMAGAFVFPGGRVDPGDHVSGVSGATRDRPPRFADLSAEAEAAYRRAAARELQEEAAVSVEADALIPFAHWVTPANEPRRYDTRFFLTEMPSSQQARHDVLR